jgi:acetyl-CoA carboxylase biotin carboxylase subunit
MRIVEKPETMERLFKSAYDEAVSAFGNGDLFVEKYLINPKHIEFQILGDKHGNVIHLGERECSLQRKHQKLLEEAPSASLSTEMRNAMGDMAVKFAKTIGYFSAGTIEYILDEDGTFYFMEMNTRVQVEHPVTEMITGIDLVREQIRVAEGKPLSFKQEDVTFTGHAVECRINAEDPRTFMPSPGTVTWYHPPGGLYHGYKVPPYYDSMIAKLIVYGQTREGCLMRLRRALGEFVIEGMKTTIPLHQRLLEEPDFQNGDYTIKWLEEWLAKDAE